MSTDGKPGLKIRRKAEDVAEATPDTPSEVTPETAPAAAAPVAETPAPQLIKSATADATDTKQSKAWRSDVAPPKMQVQVEPTVEEQAQIEADLPTTDDFASMLGNAPVAIRRVEVGQKVTAKIVAIGSEAVFVALGAKAEGALDRSELLNAEGELSVSIGDEVEAYVVSLADGIRLSRGLSGGDGNEMLVDAHAQEIPVEGKVTGTNKGGYEVEVLGSRGFCPFSHIDLDPTSQPEDHLGATYNFLVTKVEDGGKNVVVSRRRLLEKERESIAQETLKSLAPGAVFDGNVTRVADFGAFVDIGGIDGLVHVSELSWSRLDHPSEFVAVGDRLRVTVLSVSDLDNPKHRRISLSAKNQDEDPWSTGVARLAVGQDVTGVVARLEGFGAFVELGPGLDGLVHISEIAPGRRINHPREVLTVGDSVQVQVVKIDPIKRQIGLSIKALMGDPWSTAAKEMPVGSTIQGEVDSIQSFGIFVSLPGGISGLLPLSQLPDDEAKTVYNRFRPGTPIEARVLDVDAARRRLTLTRREDSESDGKAAFAQYKAAKPAEASTTMGTFADLLKNR